MANAIIALLIFTPLVFGILILIGVYVYRDAERRDMNGLLWALVAVFVPSLIGLIIYLLVRGNYSDYKCPACNAPVTGAYVVCPNCGAKLRPSCPNCSAPVEPDWEVCPRCAQPLPEVQNDVMQPLHPKDRTLGKVLFIIIVIPILLIALMVFSMRAMSGGGAASMGQISIDRYFEEQTDSKISEAVEEWIDSFDGDADHAYALIYEDTGENGNSYYALIYVPGAGDSHSTNFGQSSGLFGPTIRLELESTGNSGSLYWMQFYANRTPSLRITVGGSNIQCDVTTVDFNPVIF